MTNNIMDQVLPTFHLYKTVSVKPDKDSSESKKVKLKVKYENVTPRDLATATLGQGFVVKWQNGRARKDFDNLVNNQEVEINFAKPATAPDEDPMDRIIREAKATGLSVEDYIKKEMAKRQG